jgi:hypothetical protein
MNQSLPLLNFGHLNLFGISCFGFALKPPAFSLWRKYGNGTHRAVILAAVILHAQFHIGDEGNPFSPLVGILNDIRGTDTGAGSFTLISTDALFLIQDKLNFTHCNPPTAGRSGFSGELIAHECAPTGISNRFG